MSEPREVFIEALMKHILDLRVVPKVQVERVIGPILGLFIEEVLSTAWGTTAVICEEFPLRKEKASCLSTNIDWLLYNKRDDQLVLLELKTTCTSFCRKQAATYDRVVDEIKANGSSFLVRDLKEIMPHSTEPEKYEKVMDRFLKDPHYSDCKNAKVVYLAPAAMAIDTQQKCSEGKAEWLNFTKLPPRISSRFAAEWEIIHRNLVELDSKLPRNGMQDGGNRRNYGDTCGLDDVLLLCEEKGDSIVIGFAGGVGKLRASGLEELRNRRAFKWDVAEAGSGVKDTRNWISGRKFFEIVEGLKDD